MSIFDKIEKQIGKELNLNSKPIYYTDELKNGVIVHRMRIGQQLKRAEDYAERMLNNTLIDGVCIMKFIGSVGTEVKTIFRAK